MSFESISPNMSLILPGVGQTLGPQYATDLNNSLTIVDGHNHTAGYGVPVPSSGLNINADLLMNNNNLTLIRSLRMTPQSIIAGPSDLDCLFVNGVDLYYNDGVGNHVRITQSGGVAGSPGSISNLTSPASATYVAGSSTFVWQSAANTPANMDNASIILRNLVANSFGLTLSPPNAMGANYNITLPTLPPGQQIMTLDASGNMSAPYTVDNSTIEINANVIRVKDQGITQQKLALRSSAQVASIGGVAISPSCGSFVSSSQTPTPVTNLSVTLTTAGRPVHVRLQDDGSLSNGFVEIAGVNNGQTSVSFIRGATQINTMVVVVTSQGTQCDLSLPACSFSFLDLVAAGTYTYTVNVTNLNNQSTTSINSVILIAYED